MPGMVEKLPTNQNMLTFALDQREGIDRHSIDGYAPEDVYALIPAQEGGWLAQETLGPAAGANLISNKHPVAGYDQNGMIGLANYPGGMTEGLQLLYNGRLYKFNALDPGLPVFLSGVGFSGHAPNQEGRYILEDGTIYKGTHYAHASIALFTAGEADLPVGNYKIIELQTVMTTKGKLALNHTKFHSVKVTAENQAIRITRPGLSVDTFTSDFYLAKIVANRPSDYTYVGSLAEGQSLDVMDLPVGNTLRDGVFYYNTYRSEVQPTFHNGRTWFVASPHKINWKQGPQAKNFPGNDFAKPNTLAYSDYAYVNVVYPNNWEEVSPTQSKRITALVSSADNAYGQFGGLLVFCDNEMFVYSGDPEVSGSLKPFPGEIGCDEGCLPTKMGNIIFLIWKGKVYAISGGQITHISAKLDMVAQRFIQVVVDSATQTLFAKNNRGDIFQYHVQQGLWTRPPLPSHDLTDVTMLPGYAGNPIGFYDRFDGYIRSLNGPRSSEGTIRFKYLDFGFPILRKRIRRVRQYMERTTSVIKKPTMTLTWHHPVNGEEQTTVTMERRSREGIGILPRSAGVRERFKLTIYYGDAGFSFIHYPILIDFTLAGGRRT